ncbi:putative cysteine-rich receptor-like protein kinase 31, partial [Bienertia sinuspersici]
MSLNSVKLYTMAQCLADLAPSDCERCLGFVINELSTCCYGKERRNCVKTDEIKRIVDSLQFGFNTIKIATNNFSSDYKVGEGGFGEVYK